MLFLFVLINCLFLVMPGVFHWVLVNAKNEKECSTKCGFGSTTSTYLNGSKNIYLFFFYVRYFSCLLFWCYFYGSVYISYPEKLINELFYWPWTRKSQKRGETAKKIGKRSEQSGATRLADFSFSSFYPTAEPSPRLLFYVSLTRKHTEVFN